MTRLRRLWAAVFMLVLFALWPNDAWARAGGGHSGGGGGGGHSGGGGFSGGSHTSSHTSGGYTGGGGGTSTASGGGFDLVGLIILLAFLAGFAIIVFGAIQRGRSKAGGSADAVPPLQDDAQVLAGLEAIKAADPNFDVPAFADRANTTFLTAQKAWCDRNLAGVRAYMGQGAYLSWESQIGSMLKRHERDVMEKIQVNSQQIVRAVKGPYEHITVRFDASAADYTINEQSGALVEGDKQVEPFTEFWTFERSSGTQTLAGGKGVMQQTCPNCGAPISVNAIGECTYCKAAITNGTYDWVLQRIDQPEYWAN